MISATIEIKPAGFFGKLKAVLGLGDDSKNTIHLNNIGATLLALVDQGFTSSIDPQGRPWKPIKCDNRRPLIKSGNLRRGIKYEISGNRIEIGSSVKYSGVQNIGMHISAKPGKLMFFKCRNRMVAAKNVTIPARRFLPYGDMSPKWADAIAASIAKKVNAEIV